MESLYPSEILTFSTRVKGLAYLNFMINCANVVNVYVPPIALARSGWRFYIFYIVWDAFGIVIVYFFFVETKGRSLEELDQLFEAKNPKKASLVMRKVIVNNDGTIQDED